MPKHILQSSCSAFKVVGEFLVVEAYGVDEGGVEVVDVDFSFCTEA